MSAPTVTVAVLNYNGLRHLEPCLGSLRELDYPPEALEVMLVDNGSTDGSVPFVRAQFPEVTVVEIERNLGFAAGNNVAAQRSDATYIVFLNNDMKVDAGFVRGLVDAVAGDDAVASAGARILSWDGTEVDYAGGWIIFDGTGLQRGHGEPTLHERYAERVPTAFACGGAMILDRSVFLDVGGFDEDYFAIYEDVDLGWRLWLYGHDVVYAPAAVAYHRHHGTLGSSSAHRRTALAQRNAFATVFKNYDDEHMAPALLASLLTTAAGIVESAETSGHLRHGAFELGSRLKTRGRLPLEDTARLVAAARFAEGLPQLAEKRKEIQRRRVRTDRELAHLFRVKLPHSPPARPLTRSDVADTFGVTELFDGAPRRVLVFAPDCLPLPGFPAVGSGLRAWALGQGLIGRGHDVTFSMPKVALDRMRDTYEIPPEIDAFAWHHWQMHEIVDLVRPDVVLVCGWAIILNLALPRQGSIPVILDQHGPHMLERRYQEVGDEETNRREKHAALAAADYFTCAGELQHEYFQTWLAEAGWSDEDRAERSFPMRFSLSPSLPERSLDEELTFIFGGVWLPWQDPTVGLLTLVDELDRRGRGKLRLFGGKHPWIDVATGVFEPLLERMQSSEHVIVEGQLPHAELIRRYTRAHVAIDLMQRNPERELAVTSRTVEYLWCGLPVIYNDYSELSQLIEEYDAGWAIDPDDAEAVRRALAEIFEEPETVARKSENARRLVRERLAWDVTTERLDRVVRTCSPRAGVVPFDLHDSVASPVSLREQVVWVYRNEGAGAVAGKAAGLARRRLHLDHPRPGRKPSLLQKVVWVSINEGPRETFRRAMRRR
jgi:GT2 family glycosyltransferase